MRLVDSSPGPSSEPRVEDNLLVAENIGCTVAERSLFDDLSFTVEAGDLIEVRGANGSGKSTLLRCLVGLAEPDSGTIRRRSDFHFVGHRPGICLRMTPAENLRWLAGVGGVHASTESIDDALSRMGLDDAVHDLCDSLSAGQQRRASLARLLVHPVPLWVLDEPLTALDDAGRELMGELLDGHRATGGAAVCATHQALPAGLRAHPAHILELGP